MNEFFHFDQLMTTEGLIALATLTGIEIVLGIDNVIFIAILSDKLEGEAERKKARTYGLLLAMVQRVILLMLLGFVLWLDKVTLFTIHEAHGEEPAVYFTVKSLILLLGGLFLMGKASYEIHHQIAHDPKAEQERKKVSTFGAVMVQILIMDLVFSVDSVLTAIGLTQAVIIMVIAVMVSVGIMIAFAGPIARFVSANPSMKMLALALLVAIGMLLVAESFHHEIPKGYLYFAMAFAFGVEMLNIQVDKKRKKKRLKQAAAAGGGTTP